MNLRYKGKNREMSAEEIASLSPPATTISLGGDNASRISLGRMNFAERRHQPINLPINGTVRHFEKEDIFDYSMRCIYCKKPHLIKIGLGEFRGKFWINFTPTPYCANNEVEEEARKRKKREDRRINRKKKKDITSKARQKKSDLLEAQVKVPTYSADGTLEYRAVRLSDLMVLARKFDGQQASQNMVMNPEILMTQRIQPPNPIRKLNSVIPMNHLKIVKKPIPSTPYPIFVISEKSKNDISNFREAVDPIIRKLHNLKISKTETFFQNDSTDLFKVGVFGKSRVGKSSFLNSFISRYTGRRIFVCPTSTNSCTTCIYKIQYSPVRRITLIGENNQIIRCFDEIYQDDELSGKVTKIGKDLRSKQREIGYYENSKVKEIKVEVPIEQLRNLMFIDLPGFGEFGEDYKKLIGSCDLLFFITNSYIDGGMDTSEMGKMKKLGELFPASYSDKFYSRVIVIPNHLDYYLKDRPNNNLNISCSRNIGDIEEEITSLSELGKSKLRNCGVPYSNSIYPICSITMKEHKYLMNYNNCWKKLLFDFSSSLVDFSGKHFYYRSQRTFFLYLQEIVNSTKLYMDLKTEIRQLNSYIYKNFRNEGNIRNTFDLCVRGRFDSEKNLVEREILKKSNIVDKMEENASDDDMRYILYPPRLNVDSSILETIFEKTIRKLGCDIGIFVKNKMNEYYSLFDNIPLLTRKIEEYKRYIINRNNQLDVHEFNSSNTKTKVEKTSISEIGRSKKRNNLTRSVSKYGTEEFSSTATDQSFRGTTVEMMEVEGNNGNDSDIVDNDFGIEEKLRARMSRFLNTRIDEEENKKKVVNSVFNIIGKDLELICEEYNKKIEILKIMENEFRVKAVQFLGLLLDTISFESRMKDKITMDNEGSYFLCNNNNNNNQRNVVELKKYKLSEIPYGKKKIYNLILVRLNGGYFFQKQKNYDFVPKFIIRKIQNQGVEDYEIFVFKDRKGRKMDNDYLKNIVKPSEKNFTIKSKIMKDVVKIVNFYHNQGIFGNLDVNNFSCFVKDENNVGLIIEDFLSTRINCKNNVEDEDIRCLGWMLEEIWNYGSCKSYLEEDPGLHNIYKFQELKTLIKWMKFGRYGEKDEEIKRPSIAFVQETLEDIFCGKRTRDDLENYEILEPPSKRTKYTK